MRCERSWSHRKARLRAKPISAGIAAAIPRITVGGLAPLN
jgi:hypothetical protein